MLGATSPGEDVATRKPISLKKTLPEVIECWGPLVPGIGLYRRRRVLEALGARVQGWERLLTQLINPCTAICPLESLTIGQPYRPFCSAQRKPDCKAINLSPKFLGPPTWPAHLTSTYPLLT